MSTPDLNNQDYNQVALKGTVVEAPTRRVVTFNNKNFDVLEMKVNQKTIYYKDNELKEFDKKITVQLKDKEQWSRYEAGIKVGMKIMLAGKANSVAITKYDFIKPIKLAPQQPPRPQSQPPQPQVQPQQEYFGDSEDVPF